MSIADINENPTSAGEPLASTKGHIVEVGLLRRTSDRLSVTRANVRAAHKGKLLSIAIRHIRPVVTAGSHSSLAGLLVEPEHWCLSVD